MYLSHSAINFLTHFDEKFAESNIEGDNISIHPLGLF